MKQQRKQLNKKAQISWFIVIGIILLIIVGLFYWYTTQVKPTELETQAEVKQISLHIKQCIARTTPLGTLLMGHQGGYISFNEFKEGETIFLTPERAFPYYYENGRKTMPTKEVMEQQIASYVEQSIETCLDFIAFEEQGWDIEIPPEEDIKAQAKIKQDSILIELNYPLLVKKGDKTTLLAPTSAEVIVRLGTIIDIADEIINTHHSNRLGANLPTLAELNELHNVTITVIPYDDEKIIYSIYDRETLIDNAPLIFWFAIKDHMDKLNTPPSFTNNKDFVLTKGLLFTYKVQAQDKEGDMFGFQTDNAKFPIQNNGLFNFTPTETGTFNVKISVKDTKGGQTIEEIRFVVE